MTAPRLPIRLERAPLHEVVFEIRFAPQRESAAELLPGLLYSSLAGQFSRVEQLPAAGIPRMLRQSDPNLRYSPVTRLVGDVSAVAVGDQVVALTISSPYPGWDAFRNHIQNLLGALRDTGFVGQVERFSLKSVNVLTIEPGHQLESLNAHLELAGRPIPETGFRLRTEYQSDPYFQIVELVPNVSIDLGPNGSIAGLLLNLDCVRMIHGEDFWAIADRELSVIHERQNLLFFSMITDRTLAALQPVY